MATSNVQSTLQQLDLSPFIRLFVYSKDEEPGETLESLAGFFLPVFRVALRMGTKGSSPRSQKSTTGLATSIGVGFVTITAIVPTTSISDSTILEVTAVELVSIAVTPVIPSVALGVDPQLFVKRFDTESDVSIRRALLLTLGEFRKQQLPVEQRQPLVKKLLAVYETDPDPGMHGCAAWLLRTWGHDKSLKEITQKLQTNEQQLKKQMKDSQRRWYVTTQGQTFAILKADTFRMGSPKSEPGRDEGEIRHLCKIGRTFAIAADEVTLEQFVEFLKEARGQSHAAVYQRIIRKHVRTPDSPATIVTWYEAAAYCNWLSKMEGIPEAQCCYETNAAGKYAAGMKAKQNYLKLTGYRLPSEAEWEYACRAGATTSRYYGLTESLLPQYARYAANSEKHVWPVGGLKPNGFGLFDMQGNVMEWCHDSYFSYDFSDPKKATPEISYIRPVSDSGPRLFRGGMISGGPSNLRSANRSGFHPSLRNGGIGFRPSRTYP